MTIILLLLLSVPNLQSSKNKQMKGDKMINYGREIPEKEEGNSATHCAVLFWRLLSRGFSAQEINTLVKDIYEIVQAGGCFTLGSINSELVQRGWKESVVDEKCFELIMGLLEKNLNYKVITHTVH